MKEELSEATSELNANGVKSEGQELTANTLNLDGDGARTAGGDSDGIREEVQHGRSSGKVMESTVQLNIDALNVQTCGPLSDEDSVRLNPERRKR